MASLFSWHKVAGITVSGLAENKLTEVMVATKRVGLLKRDNVVSAFSGTCPHAGASLCEGWIDSLGRIVCPDHQYRYDPVTGRNTSGEGYKLFTYPLEIKDNEIFVGMLADSAL